MQFIPASVSYHDGRPVDGIYWIVHRPDRLDVFDYERSEYGRKAVIAASVEQPPRKPVKVVSHIRLREDGIEGHEFFELAYVNVRKPIISETFYEVCKKHKLNLHGIKVGDFNR